jgi:hypothetical protein
MRWLRRLGRRPQYVIVAALIVIALIAMSYMLA